ncbi:MAG: hypothetical protein BGO72_12300 [Burkholderiales bacterium 70-64]|nr:MAG: hypothetical protein BGO72_12300 [Burkholderiales bacterium 70-64]
MATMRAEGLCQFQIGVLYWLCVSIALCHRFERLQQILGHQVIVFLTRPLEQGGYLVAQRQIIVVHFILRFASQRLVSAGPEPDQQQPLCTCLDGHSTEP